MTYNTTSKLCSFENDLLLHIHKCDHDVTIVLDDKRYPTLSHILVELRDPYDLHMICLSLGSRSDVILIIHVKTLSQSGSTLNIAGLFDIFLTVSGTSLRRLSRSSFAVASERKETRGY